MADVTSNTPSHTTEPNASTDESAPKGDFAHLSGNPEAPAAAKDIDFSSLNSQVAETGPSGEGGEYTGTHAGHVGLGPNYKNHPTTGDKISGMTEQMKGKILRKPDLVQKGHDRQTGALAEKQAAKDDAEDPFAKEEDGKAGEKPAAAQVKSGKGAENLTEPSRA